MNLSCIVACSHNGVIGHQGVLPWRLPADMQHFRRLTIGHAVIMGRKTYDSLFVKPLPERHNIVLTRNRNLQIKADGLYHSLGYLLQTVYDHPQTHYFVIGGHELFKQLLPYSRRIYQTVVHKELVGDTYFPPLEKNEWQEEKGAKFYKKDKKDKNNAYDMTFTAWRRIASLPSLP